MQIKYFQTAWGDIRNSPNWFGRLCLLALVGLIPVFGQIVVLGYLFGWAREIAWGVHEPLPEKVFGNEDGKLYRRGWFALVVLFVFALVPSIVVNIGSSLQESGLGHGSTGSASMVAGSLLYLIGLVAAVLADMLAWVGAMRSAIYDRLAPGFQFGTIWKMFRRDAGGMARIFGMDLLVGAVLGIVLSIIASILLVGVMFVGAGALINAGYSLEPLMDGSMRAQAMLIARIVVSSGVVGIVALAATVFIVSLGSVFVSALVYRAVGYWTRQFDVYRWRGQDDPLPFETEPQVP